MLNGVVQVLFTSRVTLIKIKMAREDG